jgi:hypothetical protein
MSELTQLTAILLRVSKAEKLINGNEVTILHTHDIDPTSDDHDGDG